MIDSDRFSDASIRVKDHDNIAARCDLPQKPEAKFECRLLAFMMAAFLQLPAFAPGRGESTHHRPSA